MALEPIHAADGRLAETVRGWLACCRPPQRPSLSEWSRENARLPDGTRYRPFPFQVEIMDALSDPRVPQVTVMKSARVGWSKIVQNFVGYTVSVAPCDVAIWQPTINDSEDYAKTDLAEALSIPALEGRFGRTRDGANSLRLKMFPGGRIRINGANSPAHFRRFHADVAILEECDGFPPTAGLEGDQVELAWRRLEASTRPLRVAGSTPTVAGASKVERLFSLSTQERRWVPCPQCGTYMVLKFGDGTADGLRWEPKAAPERVWYQGPCGCVIGEESKAEMDAAGQWRADAPDNWPHRGFHVNSLYSQLPGASWLEIARTFVRSKADPQKLKVFKNQTLGETFEVRGEAPPWRALYARREHWEPGTVPRGALILTAGVDVQKDRIEAFVWGWGSDKQCWLIEHEIIGGSPWTAEPWHRLRTLIDRPRLYSSGIEMRLAKVAVDAGFATTEVASFVRASSRALVIPVRGSGDPNAPPVASPRAFDLPPSPGAKQRGLRVYLVGDHVLKSELYGLLALPAPLDGEPYPAGYVHLPDWVDDRFCQQLTAEEWAADRGVWVQRGANEALDGWKYARAAAIAAGVDRMTEADWARQAEALGDRQSDLFGGRVGSVPDGDDAAVGEGAATAPAAIPPRLMPSPRPMVRRRRSRFLAG